MDSTAYKIWSKALTARVDVCQIRCALLDENFYFAETAEQRAELAIRWNQTRETMFAAQLMLALIERQKSDLLPHI